MIRTGRTQLYILGFIFVSFILLGKQFIGIWLGKNYIQTYYISIILLGTIVLPLSQSIGPEIERAKNKQKFMCVVGILLAIANIFVSIPLIKIYGGVGAAIGTGIVLIVGFLLIRNIFYKYFLNLNVLKVLKNIYKIIPSLVIFYFVGNLILKFFIIDKIVKFIIAGLLLTAMYLIIIWFSSLNKEEKENLLIILKKFKRG